MVLYGSFFAEILGFFLEGMARHDLFWVDLECIRGSLKIVCFSTCGFHRVGFPINNMWQVFGPKKIHLIF